MQRNISDTVTRTSAWTWTVYKFTLVSCNMARFPFQLTWTTWSQGLCPDSSKGLPSLRSVVMATYRSYSSKVVICLLHWNSRPGEGGLSSSHFKWVPLWVADGCCWLDWRLLVVAEMNEDSLQVLGDFSNVERSALESALAAHHRRSFWIRWWSFWSLFYVCATSWITAGWPRLVCSAERQSATHLQ